MIILLVWVKGVFPEAIRVGMALGFSSNGYFKLKCLLLNCRYKHRGIGSINNSRKVKKAQGLDAFSNIETDYFQFQYRQIIDKAFEVNPLEDLPLNNRGKPIKNEPRKLAERFDLYQPQILHFMWDFNVPFDNNRSERDLRMGYWPGLMLYCLGDIFRCRIYSWRYCARGWHGFRGYFKLGFLQKKLIGRILFILLHCKKLIEF